MAKASEKTVLVVDDEPDVRNFLAACLEDTGFKVETASDGVEALEMVETVEPDLMTLDMVMPRKSGIRVIRSLREQERWAKLPVIVITAHAHDEMGSDSIKEFNAFTSGLRPRYTMEKPISPAKLVTAISEILQVEVEDQADGDSSTTEQAAIMNMLKNTDIQTLGKIKDMLSNK